MSLDTLAFVRHLEDAGVNRRIAEGYAAAARHFVATEQDLTSLASGEDINAMAETIANAILGAAERIVRAFFAAVYVIIVAGFIALAATL